MSHFNWQDQLERSYLLKPHVVRLNVEVDDGRLVYRATGSNKRINYKTLKKGVKEKIIFNIRRSS